MSMVNQNQMDEWQKLLEENNLVEEIFEDAQRLKGQRGKEAELRKHFDRGARAILADEPTVELVERVLRGLNERRLPMPIVHVTTRAVGLAGGASEATGFVESILANGFRPLDSNFGAFVIREKQQWRLAQPVEMDAVSAMSQVLLFVFRYLKHGTRTNKASLGILRERGKGMPVLVVANPKYAVLRPGIDADDHYVGVSGLGPDTIIGAIDTDDLSPSEIASGLFALLDNWLSKPPGQ
jgi:hypothetical protein